MNNPPSFRTSFHPENKSNCNTTCTIRSVENGTI